MLTWLNSTRLKVYPRLIAGTMGVVLLTNALLGQGWTGALGQIVGGDFIMLYSSGVLFRQEPWKLYDFEQQAQVQQALISPTHMFGVMPFNYPPYVVAVTSLLSRIPLVVAFILWTLTSITAVAIAAFIISRDLLPFQLNKTGLPGRQVFILIISSFAFIEGFQMGQNHGLTLLFVTGAVVFSLRQQWFIAGVFAGLLLYKPHFALGFLIVWFIWQRWKALAGFGAVAVIWAGGFFFRYGWQLFSDYLANGTLLLKMLYLEGFGGYLEVTPYGLLIDLLPQAAWPGIMVFTQIVLVCATAGLAYYAYRQRYGQVEEQIPVYMLAIFYPLVVSPHALLHDMIIIVPALALWSRLWPGRQLLVITISIYLATFLMPLLTHALDIALLAFIPLGLVTLLIVQISRRQLNQPVKIIVNP